MSLGDYCRLNPHFSTQCGYASVLSTHSHVFPESRVDTLLVQHAEPDSFLTAQTVSSQVMTDVRLAIRVKVSLQHIYSKHNQHCRRSCHKMRLQLLQRSFVASCNAVFLQTDSPVINLLLWLASHCCKAEDRPVCLDASTHHASTSTKRCMTCTALHQCPL